MDLFFMRLRSLLGTHKISLLVGFSAIIFVGIPLTVYLLQQQQIYQQQASANCTSNDVIYCGAGTKAAMINAMRNGDGKGHKDITAIFNQFGITEAEINASNTVPGRIYRDGRITTGTSTVVARNARTVGRSYIPGSTKCGSVYCRPPSVSFAAGYTYGNALVHVENGVFKWAVMTSCGNPVYGTPIVTPTPTKKPTSTPTKKPTPTPTKKPTPSPTKKPTPTPTKKPTPTPTKKPTATPTLTPTITLTPTPTITLTPTPTVTPTPIPTNTPTPTLTFTPTPTNTPTMTPTIAFTPTMTPTGTLTPTAIPTSTNTPAPTTVLTNTPTPTTTTIAATSTPTPTKPAIPASGPEIYIGFGAIGVVLTVVGGLMFFLL